MYVCTYLYSIYQYKSILLMQYIRVMLITKYLLGLGTVSEGLLPFLGPVLELATDLTDDSHIYLLEVTPFVKFLLFHHNNINLNRSLIEVEIPHDPSYPSVGWLVCLLIRREVTVPCSCWELVLFHKLHPPGLSVSLVGRPGALVDCVAQHGQALRRLAQAVAKDPSSTGHGHWESKEYSLHYTGTISKNN